MHARPANTRAFTLTAPHPGDTPRRAAPEDTMPDVIFEPLTFRNLTVKNRFFRSNISGRWDNYDGSGNQARINWETKFAKGGVGAIISSFVPVHPRGRIIPYYATIDRDDRIPFWRAVGEAVHEHDCKFILQLSHGGRQRDIPDFLYETGQSSTDKRDPLHGFECERMTIADIKEVVDAFAEGARRAREAGLDGVELHGANGYLITQFLSSAINDRKDEYGGPIENRARFVLDVVRAIRAKVGSDFHLQMKISAVEHNNALRILKREGAGNTLQDSVQVCQWLVEAGVDAIHVSTGSSFPHPRNPAGADLDVKMLSKTYDQLAQSGATTFRNLLLFHGKLTGELFRKQWLEAGVPKEQIEGLTLPDAEAIKKAVSVPVICTGGFQTASVIRRAIASGQCDAVSAARPLVANNDLVQQFAAGRDQAEKPCTYCNNCLLQVVEAPLGCYDETRFESREAMLQEVLTVFQPPPFR
jgi:2,4-dienoyl-CoA reductase-like NADH-dependent reductase (Old Yellow Enzyme family)